MVDNATVEMSTRCVNEDNTCAHETYIDCQENNEDGRFLLSNLTVSPTAETCFLIKCEADLYGVELNKSVMLAAKRMLECKEE